MVFRVSSFMFGIIIILQKKLKMAGVFTVLLSVTVNLVYCTEARDYTPNIKFRGLS